MADASLKVQDDAYGTKNVTFLKLYSPGPCTTENMHVPYQVNNATALYIMDNMEPCPAYVSIHTPKNEYGGR